jgi:hypothetical protein
VQEPNDDKAILGSYQASDLQVKQQPTVEIGPNALNIAVRARVLSLFAQP